MPPAGPLDPLWDHFAAETYLLEQNGVVGLGPLKAPELTNPIHPVFLPSRWVANRDHDWKVLFRRMDPAFRLASFFLTERCALPWLTHLTLGRRQTNKYDGRKRVLGSKEEHTDRGRALTVQRLRDLGNVITFTFNPDGPDYTEWGITYPDRRDIEWGQKDRKAGWPYWPRVAPEHSTQEYARRHPAVCLKHDFGKIFGGGWTKVTDEHKYRAWFMLATTLVHEVTHAYYYFQFRGGDEPLWSPYELQAELGFSWEKYMFGRNIDPFQARIHQEKALACVQTMEWSPRDLKGRPDPSILNLVENKGEIKWKRKTITGFGPSQAWRGNQWFLPDGGKRDHDYLSIVQAVPMPWVFQ